MKGTVVPSLCSLITRHLQSAWDSKQLFLYLPGSLCGAAHAQLRCGAVVPCKAGPFVWPLPTEAVSVPCQQGPEQKAGGRINLFMWCARDCHNSLHRKLWAVLHAEWQTHLKNTLTTGEDAANPSPLTKAANTRCYWGATAACRMCCLAISSWKRRHAQRPSPESHQAAHLHCSWKSCRVNMEHPCLGKCKPQLHSNYRAKLVPCLCSTWMWQQLLVHKETPLSSLFTQLSVFKPCLFTRSHAGWKRKNKITLASSTIT